MKRVAILQSNYIPWKGYFDLINSVDEFIFYDEVQYTKNDWRNRNIIKTPQGKNWITIPVKHSITQKINEIVVQHPSWARKHYNTLISNYTKSPYFSEYNTLLKGLYHEASLKEHLCGINYLFIKAICSILEIKTEISNSVDYTLIAGKTERLVSLCKQSGANVYLSGPAAKDYLDRSLFEKEGIEVEWMDYSDYPVYDQLYSPFEHGVSIFDLLFSVGGEAPKYMKSFR